MIWRNLYLLDAVTVGDLNFSESAPFSCPLLELAVLLSSLSELLSLSLWLSLSERGGEGALGAGEDGFDGEGAMLAFLRGDGDLFAFRVMGTGAIPTCSCRKLFSATSNSGVGRSANFVPAFLVSTAISTGPVRKRGFLAAFMNIYSILSTVV